MNIIFAISTSNQPHYQQNLCMREVAYLSLINTIISAFTPSKKHNSLKEQELLIMKREMSDITVEIYTIQPK